MYYVSFKKNGYEMASNYETRSKQKALDELNELADKHYALSDMPKKGEEKRFRAKDKDCRWIYVSNHKKEN